MSQWQDQIRDHQVWALLKQLGPLLDQASSRQENEPAAVDLIERLRAINAFVGRRLAGTDPAILPPQTLDSLVAQLQPTIAGVQNFVGDGQIPHLTGANSNASEVLIELSKIAGPATTLEFAGLMEAATSYRNTLERLAGESRTAVSELKSQSVALETKLGELTNDVASQRTGVISLTSDFQAQFSAAQEGRAKDFSDQQGTRQREFSETQTARQTRFDELHAAYSQRLNDQSAEMARQADVLQAESRERLKGIDDDFRGAAAEVVERIKAHLSDVEKLVGVIGNLAVTSGYQKAADSAKKALWLWQVFTMLGFIAVIIFAFRAFLPALQAEFSWERFAGRVVLTIAVGLFAAYSAAQADRYMEAERRNRKLALELEAVGPFLAALPQDKQMEFRLALGERTFGREETAFNKREKSPATVLDVVLKSKDLRQFIAEIVKASK